MAGKTAAAGERNYTIDLLRVIAAFFMACWHWIWLAVFPGEVNGGYWGAYFFNQKFSLEGWDWFKGTYTMGFFVFVTGYFMIDGFKKMQARGQFLDRRKHFMQTWRFTAKTYVAYAPLMLFGTALGWMLLNIRTHASLLDWIQSLWWNIWQFVGAAGFGMHQNFQYSGADGGAISQYLTFYNGPLWYISAFIVGACIYYAILIRNEKAAVFVVSPLLFMASNVWLNQWLDAETGAMVGYGITTFIPMDVVRLWGPLCLGIWGWYLGNAIKNAVMTKKQETLLGISWLVVFIYVIITTWTGYLGGMMNQDIAWGYVAMIALVNRDPITRGINNALQKFKPAKLFGDISAGLYVVHNPVLMTFSGICMTAFGLTKGGFVYLLIVVAFAVVFMVCNKFILKPVYGKLGKILHARDKVEVPEFYKLAENQ